MTTKLKLQVVLIPVTLAELPTSSIVSFKKFLHLTNPDSTVGEVCDALIKRYNKLYPEADNLQIEGIQDNDRCDLDPDFAAEDVFQSGDVVRVLVDNLLPTYSRETSTILPDLTNETGDVSSMQKRQADFSDLSDSRVLKKSRTIWGIRQDSPAESGLSNVTSPTIENAKRAAVVLPPPNQNQTPSSKIIPQKKPSPASNAGKRITSGMLKMPTESTVSNGPQRTPNTVGATLQLPENDEIDNGTESDDLVSNRLLKLHKRGDKTQDNRSVQAQSATRLEPPRTAPSGAPSKREPLNTLTPYHNNKLASQTPPTSAPHKPLTSQLQHHLTQPTATSQDTTARPPSTNYSRIMYNPLQHEAGRNVQSQNPALAVPSLHPYSTTQPALSGGNAFQGAPYVTNGQTQPLPILNQGGIVNPQIQNLHVLYASQQLETPRHNPYTATAPLNTNPILPQAGTLPNTVNPVASLTSSAQIQHLAPVSQATTNDSPVPQLARSQAQNLIAQESIKEKIHQKVDAAIKRQEYLKMQGVGRIREEERKEEERKAAENRRREEERKIMQEEMKRAEENDIIGPAEELRKQAELLEQEQKRRDREISNQQQLEEREELDRKREKLRQEEVKKQAILRKQHDLQRQEELRKLVERKQEEALREQENTRKKAFQEAQSAPQPKSSPVHLTSLTTNGETSSKDNERLQEIPNDAVTKPASDFGGLTPAYSPPLRPDSATNDTVNVLTNGSKPSQQPQQEAGNQPNTEDSPSLSKSEIISIFKNNMRIPVKINKKLAVSPPNNANFVAHEEDQKRKIREENIARNAAEIENRRRNATNASGAPSRSLRSRVTISGVQNFETNLNNIEGEREKEKDRLLENRANALPAPFNDFASKSKLSSIYVKMKKLDARMEKQNKEAHKIVKAEPTTPTLHRTIETPNAPKENVAVSVNLSDKLQATVSDKDDTEARPSNSVNHEENGQSSGSSLSNELGEKLIDAAAISDDSDEDAVVDTLQQDDSDESSATDKGGKSKSSSPKRVNPIKLKVTKPMPFEIPKRGRGRPKKVTRRIQTPTLKSSLRTRSAGPEIIELDSSSGESESSDDEEVEVVEEPPKKDNDNTTTKVPATATKKAVDTNIGPKASPSRKATNSAAKTVAVNLLINDAVMTSSKEKSTTSDASKVQPSTTLQRNTVDTVVSDPTAVSSGDKARVIDAAAKILPSSAKSLAKTDPASDSNGPADHRKTEAPAKSPSNTHVQPESNNGAKDGREIGNSEMISPEKRKAVQTPIVAAKDTANLQEKKSTAATSVPTSNKAPEKAVHTKMKKSDSRKTDHETTPSKRPLEKEVISPNKKLKSGRQSESKGASNDGSQSPATSEAKKGSSASVSAANTSQSESESESDSESESESDSESESESGSGSGSRSESESESESESDNEMPFVDSSSQPAAQNKTDVTKSTESELPSLLTVKPISPSKTATKNSSSSTSESSESSSESLSDSSSESESESDSGTEPKLKAKAESGSKPDSLSDSESESEDEGKKSVVGTIKKALPKVNLLSSKVGKKNFSSLFKPMPRPIQTPVAPAPKRSDGVRIVSVETPFSKSSDEDEKKKSLRGAQIPKSRLTALSELEKRGVPEVRDTKIVANDKKKAPVQASESESESDSESDSGSDSSSDSGSDSSDEEDSKFASVKLLSGSQDKKKKKKRKNPLAGLSRKSNK